MNTAQRPVYFATAIGSHKENVADSKPKSICLVALEFQILAGRQCQLCHQ